MPNFCGYPDGPCCLADGEHAAHPGNNKISFDAIRAERSRSLRAPTVPATSAAPTVAELARMATAVFGRGVEVHLRYSCEVVVEHAASGFQASFCSSDDRGATAARECARWLAARLHAALNGEG